MRKTDRKKGFSLIELVVVIGIVALLAAVLIPSIWSSMTSSKEKADEAAIENLSTTIQTGIQNSKIFKNAKKIASQSVDNSITFVYALNSDGILTYQSCEFWKVEEGVTTKVTNYNSEEDDLQKLSMQIQDFVNGNLEPIVFQSDYYKEYAYKITITFTSIDFKVKANWEMIDKNQLPFVNCLHESTSIQTATPSCDEITYNITTCSACGYQEFEEVQPLGHDLSYSETAATCAKSGQKISVCSRCDYENIETLPMTDHNYTTVTHDATCISGGTVKSTCVTCGHVRSTTTVDALGHSIVETITQEPTCTTEGTKEMTCARCFYKYTTTISKTSHSYLVERYPATCTESGEEKTKCSICGHVKETLKLTPYGHNYESKVIQEQIGATAGIIEYTCTRCEHSYTETIAPPLNLIPEGGQYDSTYYAYNGDPVSTLYTAGQEFPEPKYGDQFTYGDYVYVYGGLEINVYYEYYEGGDGFVYREGVYQPYRYEDDYGNFTTYWDYGDLRDGWFVFAKDDSQETYGPILNSINNIDVVSYHSTFAGCYAAKDFSNITIPNHIQDISQMFQGCINLQTQPIFHDDIKNMYATFEGCQRLKTVTLPTNVENLGAAFYNAGIESIALPDSVKNIENAFVSCVNLQRIDSFPKNLSGSMNYTFFSCTSLVSVPDIPSGITSMESTFYSCSSLETAPKLPANVTNLTDTFTWCTALTSAPEIPNSVTTMCNCFAHTNITKAPLIPNGVEDLSSCFAFTPITKAPSIPNTVTNISYCFEECSQLTSIDELPASIQYASGAFQGCNNLTGDIKIRCDFKGAPAYYYANAFYGTKKPIRLTDNLSYSTNTETFKLLCSTSTNGNVTYDKRLINLAIQNNCPDLVDIPIDGMDIEAGLTQITILPHDTSKIVKSFTMNGQYIEGQSFIAPNASGTVVIDDVEVCYGAFVESDHYNYAHDQDQEIYLEYYCSGALSIQIDLTIQTEYEFDYVLIENQNGEHVVCPLNNSEKFGSRVMREQTIIVPGNSVTIRFRTDGSVNNYYGFSAWVTAIMPDPPTPDIGRHIVLSKEEYYNDMDNLIGYYDASDSGAQIMTLELDIQLENACDYIILKDRNGNDIPYIDLHDIENGTYTYIYEGDYIEVWFISDVSICGSIGGDEFGVSGFSVFITPITGNGSAGFKTYRLDYYENNWNTPLVDLDMSGFSYVDLYYWVDTEQYYDSISIHNGGTHSEIISWVSGQCGGYYRIAVDESQELGFGMRTDDGISPEDGNDFQGFKAFIFLYN